MRHIEEIVGSPGSDNEDIVIHGIIHCHHPLMLHINLPHLTHIEHYITAFQLPQLTPERETDTCRVKPSRRNLVKQRREAMEVVLIDKRDAISVEINMLHKIQSCESPADYHNSQPFIIHPSLFFDISYHILILTSTST